MFIPVGDWLQAFLLTLAVEVPIVLVLLRDVVPERARLAAIAVFANLATHPAVWFVFTQLFLVGTPEYTIAAEAWAIGVEAAFYVVVVRGLTLRRAIVVSVVANAASFVVGRVAAVVMLGLG